MIWDENKHDLSMKRHIMQLIKLRKTCPALRAYKINWLLTDDPQKSIIYQKEGHGESVFIAINNSDKASELQLPSALSGRTVLDIYNEKPCQLRETLKLPAFGFAVYKHQQVNA